MTLSGTERRGVIVTGGSSGIGRAIAEAHARLGDQVVILDREAAAEPFDGSVIEVKGDVTDPSDNRHAVEVLLEAAGRVDHFVGNAGVHDGGFALAAVSGDALARVMRQVLDVDVVGYALGAQACMAELAKTSGCMTFTLSDASFMVQGNGAGLAYSSAKHAALGLVRHLAAELAPAIRVNAVAPGAVNTGLRAYAPDDTTTAVFDNPERIESAAYGNPLGVVMTPEQLASLYLFLASPQASGMTGEVIRPDGGRSLGCHHT